MVKTIIPTRYFQQKNSPIKVSGTGERFLDLGAEFFPPGAFSFHQNYPPEEIEETCSLYSPPSWLDLRTWQFCQDNNLTQVLMDIVNKIHSCYTDCRFAVSLKVDTEIPDYYILRIEITSNDSVENLLASEQRFHEWFIDNIPVDKQGFFAITYNI